MKTFKIQYLTLVLLFVFGCKVDQPRQNQMPEVAFKKHSTSTSKAKATVEQAKDEEQKHIVNSFIACWSNGRGEFLQIDKYSLRFQVLRKPLSYERLLDPEDGRLVLKLKEKDETNYISPYLSLKIVNEEEILIEGFETYLDLKHQSASGSDTWYRDECANAPWKENREEPVYLGCWSNGNGNFLEFTKYQLKFAHLKNAYYYEEINSLYDNRIPLIITQKTEGKNIKPFIAISKAALDKLETQEFDTYWDMLTKKNGREEQLWERSKCKKNL